MCATGVRRCKVCATGVRRCKVCATGVRRCRVCATGVLGDVRDDCAQTALNQALGLQGLHRCADAQLVLDQLAPAAIRALELHAPEARDGRDDQRAREEELVCEVARQAVLSAVERLLSDSEALRGLVRKCQLALEDAVVQQGCEVAFLHPHERQAEPVAERARRLRNNVLST